MKRLIVFLLLSLPPVAGMLHAQTRIITGIVKNAEDSLPLPGATVAVKGTQTGTVTNLNGFYSIDLPVAEI